LPLANLQLTANYTYLSRVNRTDRNVIPIDTPRHRVYGAASWLLNARVSLIADLGYEAGRWNQNDAGFFLRAPQYAAVGIAGMWQVTQSVELHSGVRNLLDRNYYLVEGYPEAGRTAFVNLRFRVRR
jgi:iron complex outermembrane recepter protein